MADLIAQAKGKVLDELYVPLDAKAKDFDKPISKIASLKPDVVFSTVVGQSTAIFYEAYRRAGFDPNQMPIASLTTSEAEVAEMSPEAAEGHITAAPFFEALATSAARRFISAYKLRYGPNAPVTAGAEAAYFQVHLAAGALARAGTDDPERLLPALRDAEFDAPQGRVRIDASNNHTYLWPRVAKLDARGKFQIVWNPGVRVQAGSLLRRHEPRRLVGRRSSTADPRLSGGRRGYPDTAGSSRFARAGHSPARRRGCRACRTSAPHRLHCRSAVADPGMRCAPTADIVLLTIDYESRDALLKLFRNHQEQNPTLLAVVGYESPSTLQLVLESGAMAVIDRPIRPFGLLTNLMIARSLWMDRRETAKRLRKVERKLSGIQKIQKAKSILMEKQGLTEEDAYKALRQQAMGKRITVEDMALAIINANELLQTRPKGV